MTNQDIAEIHGYVQNVKHNAEVGVSYMKSWERDEMIRKEGREEGIMKGENRLAGLTKLLLDGGRLEELNRALTDADYRERLFHENNL